MLVLISHLSITTSEYASLSTNKFTLTLEIHIVFVFSVIFNLLQSHTSFGMFKENDWLSFYLSRFEEDDEDDSDGEGRDSFVENVEFEPPRVQELIDPSLSNWVS